MPEIPNSANKLRDEAIEWLIRLNVKPCPPCDLKAFEEWIQQSPAHQKAFEEVSLRKNLLKQAAESNLSVRRAALSFRPKKTNAVFYGSLKLAAAACVCLLAGAATFSSDGWYGTTDHVVVGHGDREAVKLADGSSLELNTGSEVKIRFNRWQRSVELLKGEVYFNVVHDDAKPFIVSAGSGRTVDIGTAFEVYRRSDGEVIVAVQEGRVRVEAGQTKDLSAAESVSYNLNGVFTDTANKLNASALTAWRRGKLIFDDCRLEDVLNEFRRYHNVRIRLAEAGLGGKRLSGTFPIAKLETNLAVIAQGLGLTVQHLANGELVIAKQ